jgi:hypothetical protein
MSGMRAAAAIVALVSTVTHLAGAAETKALDLAAIVSKTDAASALGEPVKDPQSRNDEATDGYYSRCNYYSQNPGRSLVLRLRQAGAGQLEPAKQLDELMAGNVKIKPLAGFGEKAAVASEGAQNGLSHLLMLYVVKRNALVTVGLGGINDEKAALEKAKKLARKILAKL